ncbi:MAG: DUF934 domain-containing protein [Hyphomicrobiales bacterium]|nr:DUF934 domain-containing protein [Hyphomicrobiales bacterium]
MTCRLWKNRQFRPDAWRYIEEGEDIPPSGRVILPLDWWRSQRAVCDAAATMTGVRLSAADGLSLEQEEVDRLALVALEFPIWTDGRAYSAAAVLRERHGFRGTLRACGDILADQIQFMERCGFDEFEIEDCTAVRALETARLPRQRRFYQSGAGDEPAGQFTWRRVPALAKGAANRQGGDGDANSHSPILTAHWG